MDNNTLVIVVEKGMVMEVHSNDAELRIVVVDIDNKKVGEDYITGFTWPETQYNEKRVTELLKPT